MVDVDIVYKTVLSILNKEQRGYMTPDEFNKIGSQVQREIFERYFEDLNQQVRIPQVEMEYSNRVEITDEKIAEFKTENDNGVPEKQITGVNPFTIPSELYRLGTITYQPEIDPSVYVEMQRVSRADFYNIRKSPLTTPTLEHPIYLYEDNKVIVYPQTIASPDDIKMQYVKKPTDIIWNYQVDPTTGAFIYNPTGSVQFGLHNSERTEVILNILVYAGIVIRDPQVVQAAVQEVQQDEVNEKS